MPTPKKGARLGGSPAHQKLIVANLATSLFEHGRITTTEAKARKLRPYAERPGGYTRITKVGPRKGDNAPMAVIELVTEEYSPKAPAARRTTGGSTAPAAAPADTPADTPAEAPVMADPVEAEAEDLGIAAATETEGADTEAFEETAGGVSGPYPGSHALLEDASQAPEGFPVKGNEDSKKYHEPDGQWYDQTTAEVWFESAEAAEAAGFTKAGE